MRKSVPLFGGWVLAVRTKHGLSRNQVAVKTGIDRFTLSNMEQGLVPRLEYVEQFARAFGEDVNAARVLAGFEALPTNRIQDAAPDLYEACRVVFPLIEESCQPTGPGEADQPEPEVVAAWHALRAALAKAEGGER